MRRIVFLLGCLFITVYSSQLTTFCPEKLRLDLPRGPWTGNTLQETTQLLDRHALRRPSAPSFLRRWMQRIGLTREMPTVDDNSIFPDSQILRDLKIKFASVNSSSSAINQVLKEIKDPHARYIPPVLMRTRYRALHGVDVTIDCDLCHVPWQKDVRDLIWKPLKRQQKQVFTKTILWTSGLSSAFWTIRSFAKFIPKWQSQVQSYLQQYRNSWLLASATMGLIISSVSTLRPTSLLPYSPIEITNLSLTLEEQDLRVGDRLLKVGKHLVSRKSLHAIQQILRNEAIEAVSSEHNNNSSPRVNLVVRRNIGDNLRTLPKWETKDISATPEAVHMSSVHQAHLLPYVSSTGEHLPTLQKPTMLGYLAIREFTEETFNDFSTALLGFQQQLEPKTTSSNSFSSLMKGLVIDLRGNLGGSLAAALDCSAMFLPRGTQLVKLLTGGQSETVHSTNRYADTKIPLWLLTDEKTASASEAMVEALCSNRRAISLGTCTLGKNTAQAIITLSDGSGLCFTIREFRSPDGRSLAKGHIPSFPLPPPPSEEGYSIVQSLAQSSLNLFK